MPLELTLAIDRRVLAYVLALSTATSLFFGLLPARRALRLDLVSSLKADSSGSAERQRLRRLLVAGQVAVCSALVIWSVLFLRSLGTIYTIDPGFDSSNVMLATTELDRGAIDAERGDAIVTEWMRRVAASPGVQSVTAATVVPLALTGREEFDVSLVGDAADVGRRVVANRVAPGWFATMRVPLVGGRDFTSGDSHGAPGVAIVNETLARQFWNGRALGERLRFGDRTLEVVGIARDSKYRTLAETARPLIYLPLRQEFLHFVTLHARTTDPRATAATMTRELQQLVPGADAAIESMDDAVSVAVLPAQIGAAVTGVFGLIAVVLAALGVYGLVSFSVVQRTREIGIRRAIGATTDDVMRLVIRHHATPVVVGLTAGLTGGMLGARLLAGFLAGVRPTDLVTLGTTVAVVAGAALLASALPARRATQADLMSALRDT